MIKIQNDLHKILEEMLQGLSDPANHYMVSASYFEYLTEDDKNLNKHHIAVVYFHKEAVWSVELTKKSLYGNVLLNPDSPEETTRIRIPLSEIWAVQKSDNTTFTIQQQIYYADSVFKNMLNPKHD